MISACVHLADALPGRFARGRVEHLALAPVSLGTRGVRTFGVRCRSDIGQLFLLAEVPSLAEVERAQGHLQSAAESNAVHRGNDRHGQLRQLRQGVPHDLPEPERVLTGRKVDQFLDIAPGCECFITCGRYDKRS